VHLRAMRVIERSFLKDIEVPFWLLVRDEIAAPLENLKAGCEALRCKVRSSDMRGRTKNLRNA
jgi:hypothetical protein